MAGDPTPGVAPDLATLQTKLAGRLRRATHVCVAADGRFLMMRQVGGAGSHVLIDNWFEELKRRVPN